MIGRRIIEGAVGALLAGAAVTGLTGWYFEHKKIGELEAQMEVLKREEMRSAVDRSVSRQMEEIANEQREISDEKREEALQQTRVANEMRARSEFERLNALEAEKAGKVTAICVKVGETVMEDDALVVIE